MMMMMSEVPSYVTNYENTLLLLLLEAPSYVTFSAQPSIHLVRSICIQTR